MDREVIEDNCCIVVTDGSYMRELYPQLNLVAFVLECPRERGHLMGSFLESTPDACSYRRALLGLMAKHLIHCLQLMNVTRSCRGPSMYTPIV
jgi:hypothetical protein